MVQRKAPISMISPPSKPRKPQLLLENQPSKKLERSISMKPKLPNYMSPTKSWDKKKEKSQVTTSATKTPKSSNFGTPKSKKMRSSVKLNNKAVVLNRATCSSTLKDSKFPAYLDVNHEGSEAEGTSVFRVCPYTYCSLNGHKHENLGSLKSFISKKRKLVKAQKSIRFKSLSSFKFKGFRRNMEENDTGQNSIDKASPGIETKDFFVEIYSCKPKEVSQGIVSEQSQFEENHMNKKSEIFADEIDACVECDQGFSTKSEKNNRTSHEDEESVVKYHEMHESKNAESGNQIFGFDCECKEEEDSAHGDTSNIASEEIINDRFNSIVEKECTHENLESMSHEESQLCRVDPCNPISELLESYDETENENAKKEDKEIIKDEGNGVLGRNIQTEEEIVDKLMSKLRITRKKMEEEAYDSRDFNPRSPNFLDIEHDPEAEKVDLKHQTMDERRNSEEWMIDYALQRAVTKLGPARMKKVALLVEAFEAVVPFEEQMHGRFMQACS